MRHCQLEPGLRSPDSCCSCCSVAQPSYLPDNPYFYTVFELSSPLINATTTDISVEICGLVVGQVGTSLFLEHTNESWLPDLHVSRFLHQPAGRIRVLDRFQHYYCRFDCYVFRRPTHSRDAQRMRLVRPSARQLCAATAWRG